MARITDFEPLLEAEKTLLRGLSSGEVVVIGDGGLPVGGAGEDRGIRGAFLLLGMLVFDTAAEQDAIKPNGSRMFRAPEWTECYPGQARNTGGAQSQLDCYQSQKPEAVSYPRFNPFIYSADTLLPIVDLEMQGYWIPDDKVEPWGIWTRVYLWLHIAAGWALSLLAVAGFSGLIRTDNK